MSAAWLNML
uniref:Uncharacterized protein n=1 Tax=Arundo donax TaxID=35708 RepID=A0A0A9GXH2_ARUDO